MSSVWYSFFFLLLSFDFNMTLIFTWLRATTITMIFLIFFSFLYCRYSSHSSDSFSILFILFKIICIVIQLLCSVSCFGLFFFCLALFRVSLFDSNYIMIIFYWTIFKIKRQTFESIYVNEFILKIEYRKKRQFFALLFCLFIPEWTSCWCLFDIERNKKLFWHSESNSHH